MTSSVYCRSVLTVDAPATAEIRTLLHPLRAQPPPVERWEPGRLVPVLPFSEALSRAGMYGRDVVFGVSDGDAVYMIGYCLQDGRSKNVSVLRDGGTMEGMRGVPTKPGPTVTHLFAVFGDGLLTPAMRDTSKTFLRLTSPQVLRVFRDQPARVLRYLAPHQARAAAMASLRRVRSRRSSRTR